MSHYEEQLDAFADGRRFVRMSRPVRNRADACCDACGSAQARLLFGLKDERNETVVFVGTHCLQGLSERGVILRRFSRESAEAAYAVRREARSTLPRQLGETSTAETAPIAPALPAAWKPTSPTALLVFSADAEDPADLTTIVPFTATPELMARILALLRASPGPWSKPQRWAVDDSTGVPRTLEDTVDDDAVTKTEAADATRRTPPATAGSRARARSNVLASGETARA